MSKRTLHILSLARRENTVNHEQQTENTSDAEIEKMEGENSNARSPPLDIFDLENAPIVILPEDDNISFSFLENNNFDLQEYIIENDTNCNAKDCFTNEDNIIPNSTIIRSCDKSNYVENISCDEYCTINDHLLTNETISNKTVSTEAKDTELKSCLVPYECSSDEDEALCETHQHLAPSGSISNSLRDEDKTLDETYKPSDSSYSQESCESDTETRLEEVKFEEAVVDENGINSARKRKKKAVEGEWIRNKNKRLRMNGQAYLGFSKKKGEKPKQNHPRKARSLKLTCNSKKCLKSKLRYCNEFTENCRQEIFKKFWSLYWDQRKTFVASNVLKTPTFKKTKEQSRRLGTYTYYLNDGNEKLQVCRTMFINTLDLGYKTIQYWVDNSSYGMSEGTSERTSMKDVVKRRHTESYKYLDQFFDGLPKLPSHYCRRDTLKLYLEYSFHNMTQLYQVYDDFCREKWLTPLGRNIFSKVFKNKNLALYTPKKDQCSVCFGFKYGNVTEKEYQAHNQRKENAREAKLSDKIKAERGEIIALTIDLQAVKLCPYLPANKIYFKTKLCCHNFTVFDLKTREVMCYWFSENENDQLKASTFVSCIINYLQENCVTAAKVPIIIYSDGCGYQNRNNVLSNALLNFSMRYQIPVFQKYLEPGHTQMECDSVHSVIERNLRHREIHLPSDYASVTIEARKTPKPYGVKLVDYKFFQDYSASNYLRYSSIRPGRRATDPVITDIKCIKYDPNGTIEVKLDFDDDFIQLHVRPRMIPVILDYPPLFSAPPKIKTEKWQHLQELKSVLPKDTHAFYDSILHA